MNANEREYLNGIAETVIGADYEVSNYLGAGFLEKVYERALLVELQKRGVSAVGQHPIPVFYKDVLVGEYFADLLVENELIVEVKCADSFCDEHLAQCINYLRGTDKHLLLLINFQKPKVEWKRFVWKW